MEMVLTHWLSNVVKCMNLKCTKVYVGSKSAAEITSFCTPKLSQHFCKQFQGSKTGVSDS